MSGPVNFDPAPTGFHVFDVFDATSWGDALFHTFQVDSNFEQHICQMSRMFLAAPP